MRIKADAEVLRGMTYGTELEMVGLTRKRAAEVIAGVVGGQAEYFGGSYDKWGVRGPDGRKWMCVRDASVHGGDGQFEFVTPILTIDDMETLQACVRALREAGAKANDTCGFHCHVGTEGMGPVEIRNLVKLFYKNEELILRMCGTDPHRRRRWCRDVRRDFVDEICAMKNPTMDDIGRAYYGRYEFDRGCWNEAVVGRFNAHYNNARYRALNLHNLWLTMDGKCKRTVEFRLFNGTNNAANVRTMVTLALLIVRKAKYAKAGTIKNKYVFNNDCAKFYGRVFLQNIGMIGDYTAMPRKRLLKHLGGSTRTVWRGRRPAEGDGQVQQAA